MDKVILIGEELYKKMAQLKKIFTDGESWQVYYLDETTGEKWVEEYPLSSTHGGGAPQLRLIDEFPPNVKH
jgi:hypothetical protein